MCFGLERDASMKPGQIAHLDKRHNNNGLDNLAYICLVHHDEYDSPTSQRKGFTEHEVKEHRRELYQYIASAWNMPDVDGEAKRARPSNRAPGHYVRDSEWAPAELQVSQRMDGTIRVVGMALYGATREGGPNLGQLDFEAEVRDGHAFFESDLVGSTYWVELQFLSDKLVVTESSDTAYHGANVSFAGEYRRLS